MATIHLEIWLYGPLARYAGGGSRGSHARLDLELDEGSTLEDLLGRLGVPAEERGIIFVNGNLAALPGLEADLGLALENGDRVGFFHRRSMWPFQYRFGARLTPQLQEAFRRREDQGVRHAYTRSGDQ